MKSLFRFMYIVILSLFLSIALISAVCVVFVPNILHALLALLLCSISVSASYILLNAEFLGMITAIVHAGGVIVMLLFGLMTTSLNESSIKSIKTSAFTICTSLLMSIATFFGIGVLIKFIAESDKFNSYSIDVFAKFNDTEEIAGLLYSEYIFEFCLIGILLLVAIVSSVIILIRFKDTEILAKRQSSIQQVMRKNEISLLK